MILSFPVFYTTKFATLAGASSCTPGGSDVDVWYKYTANTNGQLLVNLVSDAGDSAIGQVGLSAFTADGLTELDCDLGEDANRIPGYTGQATGLVSMRAGETVLLRVSVPASQSGGAMGTGGMIAEFDSLLPNDTCRNATEIVLAGPGVQDTNYYSMHLAQNEGSTGFCYDAGDVEQRDVWFSFTAPVNGEATFESLQDGGVGLAGGLELYDVCGGSLFECNGGAEPVITRPMTAGETVKVRLLRSADLPNMLNQSVRLTLTGSGCGPADTNGDGQVTPADFTVWINAFNNNLPECDQNGDNVCTPTYFTAWINNYNTGC
ncbi:MAG: hypothetical protein ED559_06305 [Phycisphaera sp.]|nr:MAG: hypothetical protein ED559_06305 [Phycisphaera sp.]